MEHARRYAGWLALGFMVVWGTGCQLEERMAWSPDGSVAAVRTGGELRLAHPDGTLSDPLATQVAGMAWLPDGSGLVLHRILEIDRWEDLIRMVPHEETWFAEVVARALPDLFRTGLKAAKGDGEAFVEQLLPTVGLSELPIAAGLVYLHDNNPEGWTELVEWAKSLDPEEAIDTAAAEKPRATVHEIAVLPIHPNGTAGELRLVDCSLRRLAEPKPSPTAPVLAYLRGDALTLVPLDAGNDRTVVADRVSGSFDWTPDGRSLAFVRRHGANWEASGLNTANIHRREVMGDDGSIHLGEDELLAVSVYAFLPRVRCLPGDRVLFAGLEGAFPASTAHGREARFYVADADGLAPVPSAPGALPADLGGFSVSRDGRRVAVVESGSDSVAVLNLESGDVAMVWRARKGKSRTLPAWRTDGELYFAAFPEGDARRPEWMHAGDADRPPEVFSRAWPAELTRELVRRR